MLSNVGMAQKDCSSACFRLFFGLVVLVVAALAQSSCIDRIHKLQSRPGGGKGMGGWWPVENPEDDDDVKGIVASGLMQYNQQFDDSQQFVLFENGTVEAYLQVRDSLDDSRRVIAITGNLENCIENTFQKVVFNCLLLAFCACIIGPYGENSFQMSQLTNHDTINLLPHSA